MLRVLVAFIAFGLASPGIAGDGPEWRAIDETTGQIRDVDGLEQLARDFPDSGSVRLRTLQPLLAAGEVEKVIEALEWLYDRGYVFSGVAQEQIPKLLEGVDPGRIAERLRAEAEVIEAQVLSTSPIAGRAVRDIDFPEGALIGAIRKRDKVIRPTGSTRIEEGDTVAIVVPSKDVPAVETLLRVSVDFF